MKPEKGYSLVSLLAAAMFTLMLSACSEQGEDRRGAQSSDQGEAVAEKVFSHQTGAEAPAREKTVSSQPPVQREEAAGRGQGPGDALRKQLKARGWKEVKSPDGGTVLLPPGSEMPAAKP